MIKKIKLFNYIYKFNHEYQIYIQNGVAFKFSGNIYSPLRFFEDFYISNSINFLIYVNKGKTSYMRLHYGINNKEKTKLALKHGVLLFGGQL